MKRSITEQLDRQWLRDRLADVGSNQSELAEALGRNRSVVSILLSGKRQLKVGEIATIARHIRRPVAEVTAWAGLHEVDAGRGFADMEQPSFKQKSQQASVAQPVRKGIRHPAFGALKGMITLLPGVDYTQPADPDWGKVYED